MKARKLLAVSLTAAMTLALAACGEVHQTKNLLQRIHQTRYIRSVSAIPGSSPGWSTKHKTKEIKPLQRDL